MVSILMNLPTMALDSEEAVLTHFLEELNLEISICLMGLGVVDSIKKGKESRGTNQEGWLRGQHHRSLVTLQELTMLPFVSV